MTCIKLLHGHVGLLLSFLQCFFFVLANSHHISKSAYHIWFQVECTVDHGPPDYSISVSCPVFSRKLVQLNIDNPYSEKLNVNVSYFSCKLCFSYKILIQ